MSSLVRRLSIRAMKRAGYTREKWILVKNKRGDLVPQDVKRGGEITDADDNPIGRRWPVCIAARADTPSRPATRNPVVKALRRTKRTRAWLKKRADARAEQVPA
jgi:hypothetical protein